MIHLKIKVELEIEMIYLYFLKIKKTLIFHMLISLTLKHIAEKFSNTLDLVVIKRLCSGPMSGISEVTQVLKISNVEAFTKSPSWE